MLEAAKTLVALMAILLAVDNGFQGCIMGSNGDFGQVSILKPFQL